MGALSNLAVRYAASFPAEAARRLENVASDEVAAFLAGLEPDVAVALIEGMLPATVAAAVESMDREALAVILERLPVPRCVPILRLVDPARQAAMVDLLPRSTASRVERLIRSSADTAGALAEPVPALLSPEMSVEEARSATGEMTGPYVYVVDDAQRLVGVMHRRQLTTSDRRARVGNIMSRNLVRLPSAAPHTAVRSHPAWDEFDMLPVVGGDGVLVGVMRHRSLRRSGHSRPFGSERRAALAAFLDLGELYWGGLATAVDVMAGRRVPVDSGGGS